MPPKFKRTHADQARKYCLLGATDEQLCEFLKITIATFRRWMLQREEFRTAVNEGRAMADGEVAASLYRRAVGFSRKQDKFFRGKKTRIEVYYPPDTAAATFWLKNRQPQQFKEKTQVTGADDGPIRIEKIERVIVDP